MSDYIKLAEAPTLNIKHPECDACCTEVDFDGDCWRCPVCGTTWATDAGEDDPGTLFEEWSGETLEGDVVDPDDAATIAARRRFDENQAVMNRIMGAKR